MSGRYREQCACPDRDAVPGVGIIIIASVAAIFFLYMLRSGIVTYAITGKKPEQNTATIYREVTEP